MAENRAIRYVTSPYVIFTDCNTTLNPEAVRKLVRHYADDRVGAVSGRSAWRVMAALRERAKACTGNTNRF
ncbi:MAG: glycosyltransferase [Hymenobacter sp.]